MRKFKYIDVKRVDFKKIERIHPKAKERIFENEDIERIAKELQNSEFLKMIAKEREIEFSYYATIGASNYKTDVVKFLNNENGLHILCNAKTKEIIVTRRTQKETHIRDVRNELYIKK